MSKPIFACLCLLSVYVWADDEPFYLTLDTPPAPELIPAEAIQSFRAAEGFEIGLVASEPLVKDPVTITWDEHGSMYVVEMRGFMPDAYGTGEDAPVGSVVRLHDDNGDGHMDRREVLLDGLILPRAIAIVNEGLLVGEPPTLWLCPGNGDARTIDCTAKRRIGNYGDQPGSVEHAENGLLPALDNWLYNAKSDRRMRIVDGDLVTERTLFRGQWGISQDRDGRLFYNTNSSLLLGDRFDAQPLIEARGKRAAGLNAPVSINDEVFASRVNPGVNRAYVEGVLRADGRLRRPTSASGLVVYQGAQFGTEYEGTEFEEDVYVAEPAANAVVRLRLKHSGLDLKAEHIVYPDEKWGSVEFLTSTDERFRPVDVKVGPDGLLYIVDMYRGIIQDHVFLTDELRAQALRRKLDKTRGMGRVWRVRAKDRRPLSVPLFTDEASKIDALAHPNGWVRGTAQRLLLAAPRKVERALKTALESGFETQKVHVLWTLAGRGALSRSQTLSALNDQSARVRLAAIKAGRDQVKAEDLIRVLVKETHAEIRHHLTMYLADHNQQQNVLSHLANLVSADMDVFQRLAIRLGVRGREQDLMRAMAWSANQEAKTRFLAELAQQSLRVSPSAAHHLLDLALEKVHVGQRWFAAALLNGVHDVTRANGFVRYKLDGPHALFKVDDDEIWEAVAGARLAFTWPGDELAVGAKPLNAEEHARKETGARFYASGCATCHGADGMGMAGIGPRLIDSPYVTGPAEILIRIMLNGLKGPIVIGDEQWNTEMPGHGANMRFNDEVASGVATFVRRSWGHGARAVAPDLVGSIRDEDGQRGLWTDAELKTVRKNTHYKRYAGSFGRPGFRLSFSYDGESLVVSSAIFNGPMRETREDHFFFAPRGLKLEFLWSAGEVTGVRMAMESGDVVLPRIIDA
ncbi:MAG: c-type cytochrome [Pseudomonadota bacterium]|nr:c-type cytochrome [Pseudomonadota bacterium]